jgi:pimeloyl-ACP methyl ester carboxylesterase
MERYLEEMETTELLEGLEYLGSCTIDPRTFPRVPATFIHGACDVIAPVNEARLLAGEVPSARMIVVDNASHALCAAAGFLSTVGDV